MNTYIVWNYIKRELLGVFGIFCVLPISFLWVGPGLAGELVTQNPGPGYGTTWSTSRHLNAEVAPITRDADMVLRIKALTPQNYVWLDHVPILVQEGDLNLSLGTKSYTGNANLEIELIAMRSDSTGKFPDRRTVNKRLNAGMEQVHTAILSDLRNGIYLLRIKVGGLSDRGWLDIVDVNLRPTGEKTALRDTQMHVALDKKATEPNQPVNLQVQTFLRRDATAELDYSIRLLGGGVVERGSFGLINEPGKKMFKTRFVPKDCGFYLVTVKLAGSKKLILEKALSVLPPGDSPFLGLHAYSSARGEEPLILGRKLGFMHYRDHDMGKYTRWSQVQPGASSQFSQSNPAPFVWKDEYMVRHLVEDLGYTYLGVLYDAPEWAWDLSRSRSDHVRKVPFVEPWRKYVREMVKHYSGERNWVSAWEIWNEGKGIMGRRLKDPTIYIELAKAALEEINEVLTDEQRKRTQVVGMVGFNDARIWGRVLSQVSGFDIASSHFKATSRTDFYFPPLRPDRPNRKRSSRENWLGRASKVLNKYPGIGHWDTECGLRNQVRTAYVIPGHETAPLPDRTKDAYYDPKGHWKFGPISAIEAAAIMAKQVVAHKIAGVARCYFYYMAPRDFVSIHYAEQMLEYDGTLMPYVHAAVFVAKMLDETEYGSRDWLSGCMVRERFYRDKAPIDIIWNACGEKASFSVKTGEKAHSMFGQIIAQGPKTIEVGAGPVLIRPLI